MEKPEVQKARETVHETNWVFQSGLWNFYDFLIRGFSWTESRLETSYVNIS